jgi:hypothetical protein
MSCPGCIRRLTLHASSCTGPQPVRRAPSSLRTASAASRSSSISRKPKPVASWRWKAARRGSQPARKGCRQRTTSAFPSQSTHQEACGRSRWCGYDHNAQTGCGGWGMGTTQVSRLRGGSRMPALNVAVRALQRSGAAAVCPTPPSPLSCEPLMSAQGGQTPGLSADRGRPAGSPRPARPAPRSPGAGCQRRCGFLPFLSTDGPAGACLRCLRLLPLGSRSQ